MKKIVTLFERDWAGDRGRVLDKVTAEATWVLSGEGVATRKRDGTAVLVEHGIVLRRHDVRPGRLADVRWRAAQMPQFHCQACRWTDAVDIEVASSGFSRGSAQPGDAKVDCPACGARAAFNHWPGWLPCDPSRPEDRWHYAAELPKDDGTYELCGPKINGNPEGLDHHEYFRHGGEPVSQGPRDYITLERYLDITPIEGIVWHHTDGRMAKIKARDFGLRWPR